MTQSSQQWDDLLPRILSALALVLVGVWAIYAGGWFFDVLLLAIAGVGLFELIRMQRPHLRKGTGMAIFVGYAVAILAACLAFSRVRHGDDGLWLVIYFVAIVVVSDIAGYFVGRLIGGPKFWPQISPKKTWSGTVAGWAGAALVGVGINHVSNSSGILNGSEAIFIAIVSAGLALAAQLGDITESSIKRRAGVKDSSNLIPGHGGILDRFDGMVGVGVVVALFLLLRSG